MFCSARRICCGLSLLSVTWLATGCKRPTPQTAVQVAVLRCENLSGDNSLDWTGRAFSEMLAAQLAAWPNTKVIPLSTLRTLERESGVRPAGAPGISAERQSALLAGVNRIVSCRVSVNGGNLRLSASMEDVVSLEQVKRAKAEAPAGALFRAADEVGKQLGAPPHAFATNKLEAVRAWAQALDAADLDSARKDYERAVTADPDFGAAYLGWVYEEAERRDMAGVDHVFTLAQARGNALPEEDRARLALVAADLRQDPVGRVRALETLAKIGRADVNIYRGLADAALAGRRYRESIGYLQKALELNPNDASLLNLLGYTEAYLGDHAAAMDALRRYQALQPGQANPIDSQGDVTFYAGHYAEAEKLYLAAQEKEPGFLGGMDFLKAAQARLATGDVAGADGIFQRYAAMLDARHDASAELVKAQWLYLCGRRREAVARLSRASALPPVVLSQLALWELQLGDPTAAARYAAQATSAGQGMQPLTILAALIAQPDTTPGEWEARVQRLFPLAAQAPFRDVVAGYALLFHKQFAAAAAVLRRSYEKSNPGNEEGLPVLLAWAMSESGQWQGFTSLVGPTPIPSSTGIGSLEFLYFPRIFYLRARNFERKGQHEAAAENYRLFLKLCGPDGEIWGEEQHAKLALGGRP